MWGKTILSLESSAASRWSAPSQDKERGFDPAPLPIVRDESRVGYSLAGWLPPHPVWRPIHPQKAVRASTRGKTRIGEQAPTPPQHAP